MLAAISCVPGLWTHISLIGGKLWVTGTQFILLFEAITSSYIRMCWENLVYSLFILGDQMITWALLTCDKAVLLSKENKLKKKKKKKKVVEKQSEPWFCGLILVADPVSSVAFCEGIKVYSCRLHQRFVIVTWRLTSVGEKEGNVLCLWRSNFGLCEHWCSLLETERCWLSVVWCGLLHPHISVLVSIRWNGLWIKMTPKSNTSGTVRSISPPSSFGSCFVFQLLYTFYLFIFRSAGVRLIFDHLFPCSCQLFILFLPLFLYSYFWQLSGRPVALVTVTNHFKVIYNVCV